MIKLPFTFKHPGIEQYSNCIINYKGLDLSFLSLDTTNYVNSWNMPSANRMHDNRELVIRYNLSSIVEAKNLSDFYMLADSAPDYRYIISDEDTAEFRVESCEWDDWSNSGIQMTVRILLESGFIHKTKIFFYDFPSYDGLQSNYRILTALSPEDIHIHVEFYGDATDIGIWQGGNDIATAGLYLRTGSIATSDVKKIFDYDTKTGDGFLKGGKEISLATAIRDKIVEFYHPQNFFIKPGNDELDIQFDKSYVDPGFSFIEMYKRRLVP